MKLIFKLSFIGILSLLIYSCKEESVKTPVASVEVNKTNVDKNESVEFIFTGEADQVVVFTGDKGHNFDLKNSQNIGVIVNKNRFSHSYRSPGEYKVFFIASSYSDLAEVLLQDTCLVIINVKDDDASISSISCPQILYDEVFADKQGNDWLLILPQKVLFNNREVSISSQQRLNIKLGSDSATLMINDALFKSTVKYELNSPLELDMTSNFGSTEKSFLYMLRYPEFENFKIGEYDGVLVRNIYNYDKMEMTVTVPSGTDLGNIIPEFILKEGQSAYINGIEQTSKVSAVDFTSPVTYTLKNSYQDNNNLFAVTEITVTVNLNTN